MNEYAQKIVLILLNIVTEIIGLIIYLIPVSDSVNAEVITVILGLFLFLYVAVSIGIILSTIICNRKRCLGIVEQIVTTIAGLAYLTGGKLTLLVAAYQKELNCTGECLETVRYVGTTLLVASLVLFGMVTTFLRAVSDLQVFNSDSRGDWSSRQAAGAAIALIVELDAWLSTIAGLQTISASVCPPQQLKILWVLYAVTMTIWAIILAVILVVPGIKSKENCCKVFVIAIVIWFSTASATIADNDQPIGCLFDCGFTKNGTLSNDCNDKAEHGTRIGILFLALIPLAMISVSLIVHKVKKKCKCLRGKETV